MRSTIRLETVIDWPVEREKVMRDTLNQLPEVMVDNLGGWTEFSEACQRLKAAEQLVKIERQAMRKACAKIRGSVYADWSMKEISKEVKAVLNVW